MKTKGKEKIRSVYRRCTFIDKILIKFGQNFLLKVFFLKDWKSEHCKVIFKYYIRTPSYRQNKTPLVFDKFLKTVLEIVKKKHIRWFNFIYKNADLKDITKDMLSKSDALFLKYKQDSYKNHM